KEKITAQVSGVHLESRLPVTGYEIHMGRMGDERASQPVFQLTKRGPLVTDVSDGMKSSSGSIWGTYLHGVFDGEGFRHWWLNRLRRRRGLAELPAGQTPSLDGVYDRLAAAVRPHLNLQVIDDILRR
ncbi:MAG: hypothetical protein Q8R91_07285, partial [Candidatus Omnitrophota bacterium]|nr:hypothetical protein [Candidatus Omnitrophota bacterium]